MNDSRSAFLELKFRLRVFLFFCILGALAGGAVFVEYLIDFRLYTFDQYIRVFKTLFFDPRLDETRTQLILSSIIGALVLCLPVVVFYVPKKKGGEK